YCENRDSGLLAKSNAAEIAKELEHFTEGDNPDAVAERHSHWACGWIEGYAIRVYRQTHIPADGFADGGAAYTDEECLEITEAFRTWCYLQQRLADYPVLDESDYSKREYEVTLANIECEGRRDIRDDAPAEWPSLVFDWLWNNEDFPHELA